jgi:hypothetical protein
MKLGANLTIGGALFLTAVVVGVFAPWLAHTDPVMDANLMVAEEPPAVSSGSAPTHRDATSIPACCTARASRSPAASSRSSSTP